MMKIKIGIIIILSLTMIGCKDKKEEDVDYYPKTVYVDDRGNKVTMLNDSILIVCTCLEYLDDRGRFRKRRAVLRLRQEDGRELRV